MRLTATPLDDPYDWHSRVEAWEEVAATDAFAALRDAVCKAAAVSGNERVLDLGAGRIVALALAARVEQSLRSTYLLRCSIDSTCMRGSAAPQT